ncbi:unnamed protein product [Microthlaspi erraticum]|uniref:Uncharacterized protein n=1 Tax=Microthlaspi erraticum TaxID=1685480 RepID=A0A6D2HFH8_9BRAS|nr:unnamed protein product [Microthlaspi erraticum]
MKVTWHKNTKKRPRVVLSNFSEEAPETQSQRQFREDDFERRKAADGLDSSEVGGNDSGNLEAKSLAESFRAQGDKLAEEGKYKEALGKWEAALNLVPENAVLHEQKAQVLLELGDSWKALKAASRATEIDPSWAEAWTTLGRAQLNFGEPDTAIKSFETALSINADSREVKDDLQTAKQLIKKRDLQLQTSGEQDTDTKRRFVVGDINIEPN